MVMILIAWVVLIGLCLIMVALFNYMIYNKKLKMFLDFSIVIFALVVTVYLYYNFNKLFFKTSNVLIN